MGLLSEHRRALIIRTGVWDIRLLLFFCHFPPDSSFPLPQLSIIDHTASDFHRGSNTPPLLENPAYFLIHSLSRRSSQFYFKVILTYVFAWESKAANTHLPQPQDGGMGCGTAWGNCHRTFWNPLAPAPTCRGARRGSPGVVPEEWVGLGIALKEKTPQELFGKLFITPVFYQTTVSFLWLKTHFIFSKISKRVKVLVSFGFACLWKRQSNSCSRSITVIIS